MKKFLAVLLGALIAVPSLAFDLPPPPDVCPWIKVYVCDGPWPPELVTD